MKDPLDQFWNSELAAQVPTVEEMARAEALLCTLEPAPKLPREKIDAMVQAAVQATEPAVPAVRSFRRMLVAAAAVMLASLSVASLAWRVTVKPAWSEGTKPVGNAQNPAATMDYVLACSVVTDSKQPEENKLIAFGIIDDSFAHIAITLRTLCADVYTEPLRGQARGIRDNLTKLLREGTGRAPKPVDLRREEMDKAVRNEGLEMAERQAALTHLGFLAEEGLRAFMSVELVTADERTIYDFMKQRFEQELAR